MLFFRRYAFIGALTAATSRPVLAMQSEPHDRVKRRRLFTEAEKVTLRAQHVREAWGVLHPSTVPPKCNLTVASTLGVLSGDAPAPIHDSPFSGLVPPPPPPWRPGLPLPDWRDAQCDWLRRVKVALTPMHEERVQQSDPAIRPFVERSNSFVLEHLLRLYGHDDPQVWDITRFGARVEGYLGGRSSWPVVDFADYGPIKTKAEVIHSQAPHLTKFLKSVRSGPHDATLWESSLEDVQQQRMYGPFDSVQAVCESLGVDSVLIHRRFAVVQPDKTRPCGDARRSGGNLVTRQTRKVTLSTLDHVQGQIARTRSVFQERLLLWKRDHKAAYRQVPLHPEELRLAVVVFRHPETKQLVFFVHRALPFGFVASVTQYNRISQAIAFLANRVLLVPVDNYFDDFWAVEPASLATSGFATFGVLSSEILGFEMKLAKDVEPTEHGETLGHAVSLGFPPFSFSPTTSRVTKLVDVITRSLDSEELTPTEAGSVAGNVTTR